MIGISINNYAISFGDTKILENITFEVKVGEIVTILGSSGSGKSTILRSIASLEDKYEGDILLNETCLVSQKQCNKDIGYIFQDYALFPHLSVKENIEFALYDFKTNEKQLRVDKLLKQFDLVDHRNKQIHELSGGQQQRVSIARVLAYEPKILLLDEPFSNLDSILRKKTKIWLKSIIKEMGLSAILVTHDQKEALSVSDKIGIINNKTIEQFATPKEVYQNPKSLYIANFLGSLNILPRDISLEVNIELKEDEELILRVDETKITRAKTSHKLIIKQISYCGNYYEVEAQIDGFNDNNIEFTIEEQITLEEELYFDPSINNILKVKK